MNPSNLMVWWWVLGSLFSSISMHHVVHFNPFIIGGFMFLLLKQQMVLMLLNENIVLCFLDFSFCLYHKYLGSVCL